MWRVPQSWSQALVIPGNKKCDLRNIHWLELNHNTEVSKTDSQNILYFETKEKKLKKRRLLTTGLNGMVIEWDLLMKKPKSKYTSSLAIYDSQIYNKNIFLACEDGGIKILQIKKQRIDLIRSLMKSDSMCLSLALILPSPHSDTLSSLFAGYSDSSIRKWDLLNGNSVLQFQKSAPKNKQEASKIWKMLLFKEYLVTGDSQGEVVIWD